MSEDQLTQLHKTVKELERKLDGHIRGEAPLPKHVLEIISRLDTLEQEFKVHTEEDREFMERVTKAQTENTEALKSFSDIMNEHSAVMNNHIERTEDVVVTFENLEATGKVFSGIGKASAVIVKIAAAITILVGVAWGIFESSKQG